jgi:hypothetical protein
MADSGKWCEVDGPARPIGGCPGCHTGADSSDLSTGLPPNLKGLYTEQEWIEIARKTNAVVNCQSHTTHPLRVRTSILCVHDTLLLARRNRFHSLTLFFTRLSCSQGTTFPWCPLGWTLAVSVIPEMLCECVRDCCISTIINTENQRIASEGLQWNDLFALVWTAGRPGYEAEHPDARKLTLEIPPEEFYRTSGQSVAALLQKHMEAAEAMIEERQRLEELALELIPADVPPTSAVSAPPQQTMGEAQQPGAGAPAASASPASGGGVLIYVQQSTTPATGADVEGQLEGGSTNASVAADAASSGESKYCDQCGTANKSQAGFCKKCGQQIIS